MHDAKVYFRDQEHGQNIIAGWYVMTDMGEKGPFASRDDANNFLLEDELSWYDNDEESFLEDQYLSWKEQQ